MVKTKQEKRDYLKRYYKKNKKKILKKDRECYKKEKEKKKEYLNNYYKKVLGNELKW